MTPVTLEPAALRSRVKHPTTEPLWCKSKVVLLVKGYLSILQIYRQSGLWKCTKVDLKLIWECCLLNSSAADFVNYCFTNVNREANSVDLDQNASSCTLAILSGSTLFIEKSSTNDRSRRLLALKEYNWPNHNKTCKFCKNKVQMNTK